MKLCAQKDSQHRSEACEEDSLRLKASSRSPATRAAHSVVRLPSLRKADSAGTDPNTPIGIIGGGVSGVFAALTLRSLGYNNVTILEAAPALGGKAASFHHEGRAYPIGAVSTPFALRESSFTGAQIFERPLRFAASVATYSANRLQILDANNLLPAQLTFQSAPRRFTPAELSHGADKAWQEAFGRTGKPERFYPHRVDFRGKSRLAEPARQHVLGEGAWGQTHTSWPLIYVSAHGYGVARAADSPPHYYWTRFAQKSTNAAKVPALGPRGPALRGFDTTRHMQRLLEDAGVRVLISTRVSRVRREPGSVHVSTSASGTTKGTSGSDVGNHRFDHLVVATDLKASMKFLDSSPAERELFAKVRHLNYHTIASHIQLSWMKPGSVYYLGAYQGARDAADAGSATAGCPTILFQPHRNSNLTISWAYGGQSVPNAVMEGCLRKTIVSLGGSFGGVVLHQEWADYFPHVGEADLRANFHRSLDALQGKRRTTYVGEIFNLPLVSECIDWSRHLIRRQFRDVKPRSTGANAAASATKQTYSATELMRKQMAAYAGTRRAKAARRANSPQ